MIGRIIVFAALVAFAECCPEELQKGPCSCALNEWDQAMITCKGLDNDQDLARALVAVKYMQVYSVTIVDAVMMYIPHDAFYGMKVTMLEIFNSSVMMLSDTDTAFEGLEEPLRVLSIDNCSIMNSWEWSSLRNLRNLTTISMRRGDLESIEITRFVNMQELVYIALSEHSIKYIDDKAFEDSTKLKFLKINNNEISVVKRSMLPNPANYLGEIDLSSNKIEKLPGDIFTNMPQLKFLDISHNNLLYLDEQVFKPVWSELVVFSAQGIELSCDCRLTWIVNINGPKEIEAFCVNPPDLIGKNIADVTSQQLWCFF